MKRIKVNFLNKFYTTRTGKRNKIDPVNINDEI